MENNKSNLFHAHLEKCQHCREHEPCAEGAIAIRNDAALASLDAFHSALRETFPEAATMRQGVSK